MSLLVLLFGRAFLSIVLCTIIWSLPPVDIESALRIVPTIPASVGGSIITLEVATPTAKAQIGACHHPLLAVLLPKH